MNTEHTIASRYDEIVFENRNKEYGAYFIRKSYDSNLSKSTFASVLFVACLFGMGYAAMMMKPALPKGIIKDPLTYILGTEVTIIPEHKEPPPLSKPAVRNPNAFPTQIVTHEVDPLPQNLEPTTSSSTEGVDGPKVESSGPAGLATIGTTELAVIEQPKTLDIAEVMPEFEGGMKAMYKFLRKSLRYPAASRRIGEEGIVFVRFVVDVTGSITGIEVLRGVSASLDKEATRVIGLMPHWKPGKQHGSPVNVRMTLPIKFEMNQE
jgi:protein TonB